MIKETCKLYCTQQVGLATEDIESDGAILMRNIMAQASFYTELIYLETVGSAYHVYCHQANQRFC